MAEAFDDFGDGFRLVAGGHILRSKIEIHIYAKVRKKFMIANRQGCR